MLGTIFSWKAPTEGQPTVLVSNPINTDGMITRIIMWPIAMDSKHPYYNVYKFMDPKNNDQECYAVTGEIEIQPDENFGTRTNQIGASIRKIYKKKNNSVSIKNQEKHEFTCQKIHAYRGYSKKQNREKSSKRRQSKKINNSVLTIEDLRKLPEDDLFAITLQRYPIDSKHHGNYTKTAMLAQQVYCERHGVIQSIKYNTTIYKTLYSEENTDLDDQNQP